MPAERRSVRVGIVDSGINPGIVRAAPDVLAARAFVRSPDGHVQHVAPYDDALGHGSAVAALIADGAAQWVEFVDAQVFAAAPAIDAGLLAEAIDWCVENSVRVLNLSLGLHADRPLLRNACARANAAGVTLVAACPARGGSTFPAAYPQVLAVSGDARCVAGGWSLLAEGPHFGASPRALPPAAGGGASYAAARISGVAAAFFFAQPAAGYADLLAHLRAGAGFAGRECRN
jgi:subtilisin family serine protease